MTDAIKHAHNAEIASLQEDGTVGIDIRLADQTRENPDLDSRLVSRMSSD